MTRHSRRSDPVALVGAAIGIVAAMGLPLAEIGWLRYRPIRLAAGESYSAWQLSPEWMVGLIAIWAAAGAVALLPVPGRRWWLALLCWVGLAATVWFVGEAARGLVAEAGLGARVSLMGGVWLTVLASYITLFAALQVAGGGPSRLLMVVPGALCVAGLVVSGTLSELGIARELTAQGPGFASELARHLALAGTSVLFACMLGLPAAIWAARNAKVAIAVLPTASLLQTLPSLALFGLLLAPLAQLGRTMTVGGALAYIGAGGAVTLICVTLLIAFRQGLPQTARTLITLLACAAAAAPLGLLAVIAATTVHGVAVGLFTGDLGSIRLPADMHATLAEVGVRGIGAAPALIALTLYALLPVVRNCYTGIREVPVAAIEAGRGMGMSNGQLLRRIELPLALPLIVDGIRASTVLTIGITTVAFLIGAGGLGVFIQRGIDQVVPDLILLGAVPVVVLALTVDGILRLAGAMATPKGVLRGRAEAAR